MRRWSPGVLGRVVASVILAVATIFVGEGFLLWLQINRPGAVAVLLAVLGAAGVLAGLTRVVWAVVRQRETGARYRLDVAIAISLSFALLLGFGPAWLGVPALVAGVGAISLTGRTRLVFLPAVVVVIGLITLSEGFGLLEVADTVARAVVTVAVLGGMGLLVAYAAEVHEGRAELARMAVMEERLRFARDLHDVLGRGLSVIRLKAELGRRQLATDHAATDAYLAQIAELAGSAVTELRGVVAGYRHPTLAEELRNTTSILTLAGVQVDADPAPENLPDGIGDLAGAVIREGGTNVLRHSTARHCRIAFAADDGALTVRMRNDHPVAASRVGHGLTGLAERLAAVHGTVSHGAEDGEFVLTARIPLPGAALPAAALPPGRAQ